jgi:hypothetical protein
LQSKEAGAYLPSPLDKSWAVYGFSRFYLRFYIWQNNQGGGV